MRTGKRVSFEEALDRLPRGALARLREEGKTGLEIRRLAGISGPLLGRLVQAYGLPALRRGPKPKGPMRVNRTARARGYGLDTITANDIVGQATLMQILESARALVAGDPDQAQFRVDMAIIKIAEPGGESHADHSQAR